MAIPAVSLPSRAPTPPPTLPGLLHAPWISARMWVAVAVALGAGIAAYAGMYPRFDNGAFRLPIALTCAPFGAAVAAFALSGRTWGRAFWRALLMSGVLGVAATVLPSLLLANGDLHVMPLALLFGAIFGFPTGVVYGLPIAVLAALVHKRVVQRSHASNDQASRVAGGWVVLAASVSALATWSFDVARYGEYERGQGELAPFVLALCAVAVGVAMVLRATLRLRLRARWVERVKRDLDPAFRLRPLDLRDDVEALPRFGVDRQGDELAVIEWRGARERTTAYRQAAVGTAVGLVVVDAATIKGPSEEARSFARS